MTLTRPYALGLDIGIASLGFAGVRLDSEEQPVSLMFCSARLFDAAEEPKTGASLALPRRMARLLRRVAHRRAQRKRQLRRVLQDHGFTPEQVKAIDARMQRKGKLRHVLEAHGFTQAQVRAIDAHNPGEDVLQLYVKGLDELLSSENFARVLLYIAERRGVKEQSDDDNALQAMAVSEKKFSESGVLIAGEYSHTVKRECLRKKVEMIFVRQRQLGNPLASEALQAAYLSEEPGAPVFFLGKEYVWQLRVKALDEALTPEDFARVLFHIAKRRGFKSGRRHAVKEKPPEAKADKGKTDKQKEDEAALAAMARLEKDWQASGKRTIGEYLAGLDKRRNSSGEYSHTVKREWLRQEAELIFTRQRELGNPLATEALQAAYLSEEPGAPVFFQRPLKSYADKIGKCHFYPEEDRAPKCSYTGELFVMTTRIGNTRVIDGGAERSLTQAERETLEDLAHKLERVSYTQARKALGLKEEERFNLSYPQPKTKKGKGDAAEAEEAVTWKEIRDKEEKRDFIKLAGFHEIRKALGVDYKAMRERMEREQDAFDQAAHVLSFYEDDREMEALLQKAGFSDEQERARLIGIESFSKTLDLSLKVLRQIVPIMREQGLRYDEAVKELGLHHSVNKRGEGAHVTKFPETRNPVVDRALRQARLVMNAVIRRYGVPSKIMIELARETGKSKKTRDEIDKKIKENEAAKQENKEEAEKLGLGGATALLKFRLWKEQGGKCAYSGKGIPMEVLQDPTGTEIEHIIPYSRCYDDSYRNKVLVHTKVNREKGNRTAMRYVLDTEGEEGRKRLIAYVNSTPGLSPVKKQRLLTEDFDEDQWKQRNLSDTGYMARLLQEHLKSCFDKSVKIETRNGQLTAHLRRSWGFDEKDRTNDRHHALDAVVLACSTQSMVQKFAKWNKLEEEVKRRLEGKEKRLRPPMPWETFRSDVKNAVFGVKCEETKTRTGGIFCSRRREPLRASGQAHQETIRSVRALSEHEQVVVQRVPLIRVTDKMLERLWDKERNQDIYNLLKERLDQHGNNPQKAFKDPIYRKRRDGTQGPQIKHIRIETDEKSGIRINGGLASNGDMLRVDVFKVKEKGKDCYYLVPIYAHHAAGNQPLPNKAAVQGKPESEWKDMREEDFIFTLRKNDLVQVKSKSESFMGYYVGMDRATACITLRSHDSGEDKIAGFDAKGIRKSIGVKTLIELQKYRVNVFGEISGPYTEKKRHGLARGDGAAGGAALAARRADSGS